MPGSAASAALVAAPLCGRRRTSVLAVLLAALVGVATLTPTAEAASARPGARSREARVQGRSARATRAGRTGTRAPRRPSATRRGRAIPWLKGNLPNVQAHGAFVLDLAGGQELYARQPDEPRPIASISKLAAALTVVDRGLDLDALTTITRADVDVARGGARSRLLEGMTLSNRDLLHAALLGSDNRAVPALGRAVGLDASALAAAMTSKARELGLVKTRFVEPTGLSPENVSTPREIVDLLRAVMDHPVLGEVTKRLEWDAHPLGRPVLHYSNTHRPASRHNTLVLGGKTGFNNAARYCLVLGARIAGRTVAMAFLGTEGELTRFGDVARVADWIVAQETRAAPRDTVLAGLPAPGRVSSNASPSASPSALPQADPAATVAPGAPDFALLPPSLTPAPVLLSTPNDVGPSGPAPGRTHPAPTSPTP